MENKTFLLSVPRDRATKSSPTSPLLWGRGVEEPLPFGGPLSAWLLRVLPMKSLDLCYQVL